MTYSTHRMSSTLLVLMNQHGTRLSATTFTSSVTSVDLTSDHFGVPNQEIHVEQLNVRMVPSGTEQFRVSWEFDNKGTNGVTVTAVNPFSYSIFGTPTDTFMVATDTNDTTASNIERDEDAYTFSIHEVQGQGKRFEFTITASGSGQLVFLGAELEARLAKTDAYVGGRY